MSRALRSLAALLATVATPLLAQTDPLAETQRLQEAGAPQLVLERVIRLQPAVTAPVWVEWEGLRCTALLALGRHAEVLDRASALPATVDVPPCHAAAARAAVALKRYDVARTHAARALWTNRLPAVAVRSLRLAVIDALAAERRGDDAFRAMLRYQQDYGASKEVAGRFVMALLGLGMDKEALNWLTALDDAQPAKLALRLRAGLVSRETAIAQARAALAKRGDADYGQVILDAAPEPEGLAVRLLVFEQRLDALPATDATIAEEARALWRRYLAVASEAANRANLLVGDDANWADVAGRRLATDAPVARALFAHLAEQGRTAAARNNAQLQLLLAWQGDRLERTALRVFETIFPDIDALDTQVRYRLGTLAETQGRAALGARYWQDLPAPPDVDATEWVVRLARLRWLADGRDAGIDAVLRVASLEPRLSNGALAAAQRYADELAERGQAGAAARLLEGVARAPTRAQLVTLARTYERAGDAGRAAEAWLRAALNGEANDAAEPRLKAGLAAARAGYVRDARAQLEWVVGNTKDAALVSAARDALRTLPR